MICDNNPGSSPALIDPDMNPVPWLSFDHSILNNLEISFHLVMTPSHISRE
jgi:hypothetical protein